MKIHFSDPEEPGVARLAGKIGMMALLIALAVRPPDLAAQDRKLPTYTVQSQLVQIFFTVSEGRQKVVRLNESDLTVIEDGGIRVLYRLDSVEVPLQIMLLLDTSESMLKALPITQEAAVSFVESLNPGDRVTLVPFNSEIRFLSQLADDPEPIKQAIRSTRARDATRLYDALLSAMKHLSDTEGRKAIVVFSDGQDTAQTSSLNLVLNAAARYGYPIYTIGAGAAITKDDLKLVLRRLAEINGGKHYYVEDPQNLMSAFIAVAEELRSAFVLNYYTDVPHDGRWHDVEIRLTNPRHKSHSRRGFYARTGGAKAGYRDLPEVAPKLTDAPLEWASGDKLQKERAAGAAVAEILSVPLPSRSVDPEGIRAMLPQPQTNDPPEPVFKVETRFVEVPVLLESGTTKEIPPLSVKDFRVYEDEARREIAYFSAGLTNRNMGQIRDTAEQDLKARRQVGPLLASSDDGQEAALGRTFLLLDDLLTSATSFLGVKKASEQIIREHHSPLNPVSLHFVSQTEADVAVNADVDALLARLDRAVSAHNYELTSNEDVMSVYEAYLIDRGDRDATELAELRLASSARMSFTNRLGSVRGSSVASPETIRIQVQTLSRGLVIANESQVDRVLDGLRATIGAAAADPGDCAKTVILISSGFVTGFGEPKANVQQVVDLARRRRIRVFTIDATALTGREGIGIDTSNVFLVENPGLDQILRVHESGWIFARESSLALLARETGGEFLHGTNDMAAAADRILRATGRLYYMGFLSDQPSDGRFHQIRVEAAVPGVRIHARKGYFADRRDVEERGPDSETEVRDWQSLLAKAEDARRTGDGAALIRSLSKLTRIFPRSVELWFNLGAAQLQAGDPSGAARAFQRALMLAPDDTGIGVALARAFLAGGSVDAAAETIVRMIQRHPEDANLRFQLGRLYEAAARTAAAFQAYRQVLDQGFDVPLDLYLALTRTAAALGRRIEAGIFGRDYLARGGSEEALRPWLPR